MPDVEQGIDELTSAARVDELFRTKPPPDLGVDTVTCAGHRDERTFGGGWGGT